jgi:hypothetical protein
LEHLAALTAGAVREWFQSSWPLEQAFRLQSLAKALYRGDFFRIDDWKPRQRAEAAEANREGHWSPITD